MTDIDRKEIINKIQQEIIEKESLSKKYEELKKLSEDPVVEKYLNLLKDINQIESDIERYRNPINGVIDDSLEKRIKFWFRVYHFNCKHDVWIYSGSYYRYTNFKNEEDYIRYSREDLSDNLHVFSYNKYICLECREKVEISKSEWKKFEDTHLVLKGNDFTNIEYYQNLYYQLLYDNYTFLDAQQLVIEEFNKNIKNKTRVLLKNNMSN